MSFCWPIKVKRAQCFPDLFRARIDGCDLSACLYGLSGLRRQRLQTAADRRADFYRLRACLQFGDDSCLTNRRAHRAGVDYFPWLRRRHGGRLQQFENLGPAAGVAEADQRQRGIASHHERGSASILSKASWKPAPDVSCPMTQASVLRTSSTGFEARRTTCGYHCVTLGSRRVMRSPICTRAC